MHWGSAIYYIHYGLHHNFGRTITTVEKFNTPANFSQFKHWFCSDHRYKVLHALAPAYLNWSTQLLRWPTWPPTPTSATSNRLAVAVPPVKLTTVAKQPGFQGCRPTYLKRFAMQTTCLQPNRYPPPSVSDSRLISSPEFLYSYIS